MKATALLGYSDSPRNQKRQEGRVQLWCADVELL